MYVGQTCNLSERWRNNGKNYFNSIKFYNAIKKYGWDNFTHEVVYSNLNKQAADKLEKELIHKYNSIEEGYNLKEGGSRGELSTKSLAKKYSRIAEQSRLKDCLIALVEFIEVIRRRRYDNSKKDYNTHIQL